MIPSNLDMKQMMRVAVASNIYTASTPKMIVEYRDVGGARYAFKLRGWFKEGRATEKTQESAGNVVTAAVKK